MSYLGEVKAGTTLRLRANFHNDQGTLEDPTGPEAQLEKPDGTFAALAAPTKRNAKTGHYGVDIDTTGFAAGQYLVRMAGTVTTAKTQAAEFSFMVKTRFESDIPTLAEMLASAFTVNPAQIAAGVLDATVVVTADAALTVKQGDVKLYTFGFGSQWDCTGGKRIFFTVKKKASDAAAAISKECTVTTPATAAGSLSLAVADTSGLTPGEYVYEFKRRDADGASNPGTIQEGKFVIGQDLS